MAAAIFAAVVCLGVSSHAEGPVIDMLPGVVKPTSSADLSPSVEGVLQILHVKEGQWVEAGELLALVDSNLAKARLDQARFEADRTAAVELADARVDLAKKYLARIEQAHDKQAASDLELDEARGRVRESLAASAEAHEQLEAARKQLATAQARYASHEIRTPIAGEVIRIDARRGELIQRTRPVAQVINLAELQADLFVPTRLLSQLTVGQTYTLSAEAPVSQDLRAQLIYREPMIDAATNTFRCRFVIDNQSQSLPTGFTVRLRQPASPELDAEPIARAR